MSVETHVQSLDQKHHLLDQLIAQEEQRPHPDTLKLSDHKKEKLRIKDELHRYRS